MASIPESVKPSRYVWLQIMSILLPGLLVLVEFWIVASAPDPLLKKGDNATAGLSTTTVILAALVATAASYIAGTAARESMFALLLPRRTRKLQPPRLRPPVPQEALDVLGREYPCIAAESPLVHHPRLEGCNDRIAVLAYAKSWLGRYREELAIDDIGVEINIVASMVVPVLIAPFAFFRWWQAHAGHQSALGSGYWWIAVTAGALLLGGMTARRVITLARYELEDAFRNLTLARWIDEARPAAPG